MCSEYSEVKKLHASQGFQETFRRNTRTILCGWNFWGCPNLICLLDYRFLCLIWLWDLLFSKDSVGLERERERVTGKWQVKMPQSFLFLPQLSYFFLNKYFLVARFWWIAKILKQNFLIIFYFYFLSGLSLFLYRSGVLEVLILLFLLLLPPEFCLNSQVKRKSKYSQRKENSENLP